MSNPDYKAFGRFKRNTVLIIILPLFVLSTIGITSLALFTVTDAYNFLNWTVGANAGAAIYSAFWGISLWKGREQA